MDEDTRQDAGDEFAGNRKQADYPDHEKVNSGREVDSDAKEDKENNEEHVLERPCVLLERIGVGCCKGGAKRDHHHGFRHTEIHRDRCGGQYRAEREQDRELVGPVKEVDEKFLAIVCDCIEDRKHPNDLEEEQQRVLITGRYGCKDDNQHEVLKNHQPDHGLRLAHHQLPVLDERRECHRGA